MLLKRARSSTMVWISCELVACGSEWIRHCQRLSSSLLMISIVVRKVFRVLGARAGDLGELAQGMGMGRGESITTNEPRVVTEPLLNAIIVEDSQDDGCIADSTSADQSDRVQAFRQLFTSKKRSLVAEVMIPQVR